MAPTLFGREGVLEVIGNALASPGVLVTLTGLPGSGMTSLAMSASDRHMGSPVGRDNGWPPASRCVVEGRAARGQGTIEAALEACASAALLVIDDADQATGAREAIRELRRSRPEVRILATCAAPLALPGEVVVRVPPLPLPDPFEDPAVLREEPAVQLFLDVSTRTGTSAVIESASLGDIAEICRLLGGLPVAIQLLAARTATYSPATLVQLLRRTPTRLLRPRSGAQEHTHDLVSAVASSVSLLSPDQQALLQDLRVFQSPVSVDVIDEVCARPDVLDELSALVDVHLVAPSHDGPVSLFSVPPLVRDHLREATTHPVASDLHRRHRRWAGRVAAEAVAHGAAGRFATARQLVVPHERDLRAALSLALADTSADRLAATTLNLALIPLWYDRGPNPDVARTTDAVLTLWSDPRKGEGDAGTEDAGTEDNLVLAAWRELVRAELARTAEEVAAVVPLLDDLRERARSHGDRALLRVTYVAVQAARSLVGREPAEAWAHEGRELATRLADEPRLVRFETWTGMLAHQRGELSQAALWGRAAVARARRLDDSALLLAPAGLLHGLPPGTVDVHDIPDPQQLVDLARATGELSTLDWLEPTAAFSDLRRGDLAAAARHCAATLRRVRSTGAFVRAGPPTLCLFFVAVRRADQQWAGRLRGMLGHHLDVLRPALPPAVAAALEDMDRAYHLTEPDSAALWGATLTGEEAVVTALSYAAEVGRTSSTTLTSQEPDETTASTPDQTGRVNELTDREHEVLDQLSAGGTNRDISDRMGISAKTVMHHTSSIYRKLGVRGRAEAVAWYVRRPPAVPSGPGERDAYHGLHLVEPRTDAR